MGNKIIIEVVGGRDLEGREGKEKRGSRIRDRREIRKVRKLNRNLTEFSI